MMALNRWCFAFSLFVASLGAHAEVELRSGFIEVEGGPLWYEIAGGLTDEGDGLPLLTLHGGPGSASCGMQLLYPLSDERAVIRYDQLGTGRSGRPKDPSLWNRNRFVEALHTLRNELGLKRMHLQGHSWGGSLAAYYVLQKGTEGIVSLTLSSPLISTPLWIKDANALRATLDPEVQAVLDKHEADESTDHPDYVAATEVFYSQFVSRGDAKEVVECPDAPRNPVIYNQMWGPTEFYATGSLKDFDLTSRLSAIDVPTLFVTGEFDEARPKTVKGFADMVPGARFEVIPGVGHASMSRQPELYRQLLREFMREAEAAAGPPEGTDVWLLDLAREGDALRARSPRNLTNRPGYDNQPSFTPQGDVLFVQMEDGRTDLWRWDVQAKRSVRVTETSNQGEFSPTPIPQSDGGISYIRSPDDTSGRLWRMSREGAAPEVIFADIGPVGYHAWFDPDYVALWRLQDPSMLQLVEVATQETRTLATGVGRSPQSVPNRRAVSFTRATDDGRVVEAYDLDLDRTEVVALLPEGGDFHTWTPDGVLLTTSGSRVFAWHEGNWQEIVDLADLGLKLSRLAVSPDGTRLALVAEPAV